MSKIETDRFIICSDERCWWINEKKTKTKGKDLGGTSEIRVAGYASHIDDLIEQFVENKFRGADAKTVKEFLKQARDIQEETKEIGKALARRDK